MLAAIAIAFAFQALTSVPAEADSLTGCLTNKGKFEHVAEDLVPLKPCDSKSTQVTIPHQVLIEALHPEIVTTCPCDFRAALNWADWTGPVCDVTDGGGFTNVLVKAGDSIPFIVVELEFASLPREIRQVFAPDNTAFEIFGGLTGEEVADCLADINEFSISLGLVDGCALP